MCRYKSCIYKERDRERESATRNIRNHRVFGDNNMYVINCNNIPNFSSVICIKKFDAF